MKYILGLVLFFGVFFNINAQLPSTNIYSFNYKIVNEKMQLSNGKLLTNFNPGGYNNQPSFINDDVILISSNHYDAAQTDILKLDLKRNILTRVTATKQGEYSPTLMPGRRHFSVIREILGGEVNQKLWKYPINQSHNGSQALENELTVGYHSWLNGSELVTFLVGDPHRLMIHNLMDDSRQLIAKNPGRSLISRAGMLYYIYKISSENWVLKVFDPLTGNSKSITKTVAGTEDMDIMPNGNFIMASGSKLYMFNPDDKIDWIEVADLSSMGLTNLNRIKVRRNKIVLVNAS